MALYIHGIPDAKEVARLEFMAEFSARFLLSGVTPGPDSRVLDLACGVGAMTGQIVRHFGKTCLMGVDRHKHSLEIARLNHPEATYVQADAQLLPFPDHLFDLVHSSWLLEHVSSPEQVIREVHRVLKIGGSCTFAEVDNATLATIPDYPEVMDVMEALSLLQQEAGGDPYLGQRLDSLLREAGFSIVQTHQPRLVGDAAAPAAFAGLTRIFADILESVEEPLGSEMSGKIGIAAALLRSLTSVQGGAIFYSPVFARAVR